MSRLYEIPLTPEPQRFSIALGGRSYLLRVYWADGPEGGWMLDIPLPGQADAGGNGMPLLAGIPLVSGGDLLGQHRHLGIAGGLYVETELPPALDKLGRESRLLFVARGAES